MDDDSGTVQLLAHYYDNGTPIGTPTLLWTSNGSSPGQWQQITASDASPPGAATDVELIFKGDMFSGWAIIDDVTLNSTSWDMESDLWTSTSDSDFPAGTSWYGLMGRPLSGLSTNPPTNGYVLSNEATGEADSQIFAVQPFQQYEIEAQVRGVMTASGAGRWAVHYVDGNGQATGGSDLLWSATSQSGAWQAVQQTLTMPSDAFGFFLRLEADRIGGWLAVDEVSVLDLNQPVPWYIQNSWAVVSETATFPATSTDREGEAGWPASHAWGSISGPAVGYALPFNNLASGAAVAWVATPDNEPDPHAAIDSHALSLQVNLDGMTQGEAAVQIGYLKEYPQGSSNPPTTMVADYVATVWRSSLVPIGSGWQTIVVNFAVPNATPYVLVRLVTTEMEGVVAFDELSMTEKGGSSAYYSDGFEDGQAVWTEQPEAAYPATALWRADSSLVTPSAGLKSYTISNVAVSELTSPQVVMPGNATADISFWVNKQLTSSADAIQLLGRYYDDANILLAETVLWQDSDVSGSGWQLQSLQAVTHPDTDTMFLVWQGDFHQGALAVDDMLVKVGSNDLADWDMESDVWLAANDTGFPASTIWYSDEIGRSGTYGYLLSNEARGTVHSSNFLAQPNKSYQVTAQVRGDMVASGAGRLTVHFFDDTGAATGTPLVLWSSGSLQTSLWQTIGGLFTTPSDAAGFRLDLEADRVGGWLAFDGVSISDVSDEIPAGADELYELSALVRGDMAALNQTGTALMVYSYDSNDNQIGEGQQVWGVTTYDEANSVLQSGRFRTPANTDHIRVGLLANIDNDTAAGNWVDYKEIRLTAYSTATPIRPGQDYTLSAQVKGEVDAPDGVTGAQVALHFMAGDEDWADVMGTNAIWQVEDFSQPSSFSTHSGSGSHPTATHLRVGLTVLLDGGWLKVKNIDLSTISQPIAIDSVNSYQLTAHVEGNTTATTEGNGAKLFVRYDTGTTDEIWSNPSNGFSGTADPAVALSFDSGVDSFQIESQVRLDKGHMSFSDLDLLVLSGNIAVMANSEYGTQVKAKGIVVGEESQTVLRLGVYDDTSTTLIHDLWTTDEFHHPAIWKEEGGAFTAASTESVRLGVTTRLDDGWFEFESDIWSQVGDLDIAITAGETYTLTGQFSLSGSQGGEQVSSQLYARYYDTNDDLIGDPVLLLDTSDEPSGTTDFVVTLLPPPDATKLRLASTVHLLDGTATYTANEISHRLPGSSTQRSTYYLAGKAIATRVKVYSAGGDSNDLYYFHSDHLGSASVMSDDQGVIVPDSTARYLPFGDWRTEPTVGLTELGYTGHHHDNLQGNDLGLIYMNARYYVPNTNRMASPDSIVPDPTNPQSFNRYSYVNNRPVNYTDPSGHCAVEGAYGKSGMCAPAPRNNSVILPPFFAGVTKKFDMLPFDISAYGQGGVQPFGATTFAYEHRPNNGIMNPVYDEAGQPVLDDDGNQKEVENAIMYAAFAYLHGAIDIPLPAGTSLQALGTGKVFCSGFNCGQTPKSGGQGVGIHYEFCDCIVYYVHTNGLTATTTDVEAGMEVATSGASSDGYEHLHLEIRPFGESSLTVYDPRYFFEPDVWNSANFAYMPYQNNSQITGFVPGDSNNYWSDAESLDAIWTR